MFVILRRSINRFPSSVVGMSKRSASIDAALLSEGGGGADAKKQRSTKVGGGAGSSGGADGCPAPLTFVPPGFNAKRGRLLTEIDFNPEIPSGGEGEERCVVYWMSRDQRAVDNHALSYARALATQRQVPFKVVFNLVPQFLEATLRQYGFMVRPPLPLLLSQPPARAKH